MPKRKVAQCVIVQREGKRLKIMPGETFDFAPDELADIKRLNPDAIYPPVEAVVEKEVKLPGGKQGKADDKDDL